MYKYSYDIMIPESIIKRLNSNLVELNVDKMEEAEEDMHSENSIIPFSILFDVDLACVLLIKEKYNKIDFWNEIINESESEIRARLMARTKENPLSVIKSNKVDDATIDNLYKELMIKHYPDIIADALKKPTMLMTLIDLMCATDPNSAACIYCDGCNLLTKQSNEIMKRIQSEALNKFIMPKFTQNKNITTCTEHLRGMDAFKDYSVIFYKYISELEKDIRYPSATNYAWSKKTILCADYGFNMDEKASYSLKLDTVLKIGISNQVGTTSLYRRKDLKIQ